MQAKFYDSRVTSEVSLVRGGAVGARLIHTSIHARLDGGGAPNSSPGRLTWNQARSVVTSCQGEQGFARTKLIPAKFWYYPQ
jgi:hypothetical protein